MLSYPSTRDGRKFLVNSTPLKLYTSFTKSNHKKMKRQATNQKKIYVVHISNKELLSRIYKEFQKSLRTSNLTETGKRPQRHSTGNTRFPPAPALNHDFGFFSPYRLWEQTSREPHLPVFMPCVIPSPSELIQWLVSNAQNMAQVMG